MSFTMNAIPVVGRFVTGSLLAFALLAASVMGATSVSAGWDCSKSHKLEPTEPINIGQLKLQLRDYRYRGRYDQDAAAKLGEAKAYLQEQAPNVAKPALVLDIDETSLSNWAEIEQNDFAYIPGGECSLQPGTTCGDLSWELSALAEAIPPTLDLFNTAKRLGVPVFFITGRPDRFSLRAATIKNLREAGYDGWQELIMRPIGISNRVQIESPRRD